MDFEVGGNEANLEFEEGSTMAGAQVRVSIVLEIEDFVLLQSALGGLFQDGSEMNPEGAPMIRKIMQTFARDSLLSWNLTRDGVPLPVGEESFMSLRVVQRMNIINAWAAALSAPPPNSVAASENGARSAADLGMTAPV